MSSLMRSIMKEKGSRQVEVDRRFHIYYLRTSILFGEATKRGANSLKWILHEYDICSGQSVNYTKSTIFYSSNTQEEDKRIITRVLGVHSSNDPER
ncbi:LINE-1 reverse transcriptase isogeny [Gossypium australe]|uniref:LINE-1 reverse transcriptase isogeny n=1 Tax=Gossypium australe TaxID=47621 RepID=A0A5B6VKJ3_9ROSI|nr:LINE-1 reverse transcriptase isogeny [Gossypium australe]